MAIENQNDLGEHTVQFARAVREYCKGLPMTVANVEDIKELVRCSGAVGATYIAAREAASKREYLLKLKECGKLAHTSGYWLQLLDTQGAAPLDMRRRQLIETATDLAAVYQSILQKANTQ